MAEHPSYAIVRRWMRDAGRQGKIAKDAYKSLQRRVNAGERDLVESGALKAQWRIVNRWLWEVYGPQQQLRSWRSHKGKGAHGRNCRKCGGPISIHCFGFGAVGDCLNCNKEECLGRLNG